LGDIDNPNLAILQELDPITLILGVDGEDAAAAVVRDVRLRRWSRNPQRAR